MGEFADDFLDDVIDYEDYRWQYRHGQISDEDAYDMGLIDEDGYELDGE
jgi:hypothetical protein